MSGMRGSNLTHALGRPHNSAQPPARDPSIPRRGALEVSDAISLALAVRGRRADSGTITWMGAAHDRRHSRRNHRRVRRRASWRHRHAARSGGAGHADDGVERARASTGSRISPLASTRSSVELPGFATKTQTNIPVALGATQEVPVQMNVSTQQETITVVAESPVVDAATTEITHELQPRVGRERPGAPVHVLRPRSTARRASRWRTLDQLALAGVRVGDQREPVPARRHRLHRAALRRRLAVAEHRRHRRGAGALARRQRRVRQRRRRRVQHRHPAGLATSSTATRTSTTSTRT